MKKNLDLVENAIWKQRYRAHSINWAKIANLNPQRGLVCSDRDGVTQLYAWDRARDEMRRLTDKPAGVTAGMLAADGEYVYYLRDDGGSETGHFVRVPFGGGLEEDVTPELPEYGAFVINQSYRGNMLGTRIADRSGQALIVFAPEESPRQIYKSQSLFFGPSLTHDGEIGVIASTEGTNSMDTKLIAFDVKSGEQMAELWDGEGTGHSLGDFAPLPGDFRLLSSTSKSGYERPIIWNPLSGERRDLAVDDIPGEVNAWQWSKDGKQVLLSQLHQARQHLYIYDLEKDSAEKLRHPDGVLGNYLDQGTFTDDGRILIPWQDPAHPPRLIALDGRTGEKLETVLAAGDAPGGKSWKSVNFSSENGDSIHAWLALPGGEGPFPTIFHTHGGPTVVMSEYFSPECQAWLDHGFAFFSINYHGSTTFGKDFEKSIIGRLGELEVKDMAAGYRWLVENKISQPDAIFLTGVSYGGYLTLLALGKRPALWAGGMADVAIADWTMLYEDESESLRGYQRVLFGGSPQEKPETHRKSSPITYADQVQAPIMVIQGSNDTRCPPRQMQAYEARLKELGKEIVVHWFEAGHGSRAQEQRVEDQERKMLFVQKILGR